MQMKAPRQKTKSNKCAVWQQLLLQYANNFRLQSNLNGVTGKNKANGGKIDVASRDSRYAAKRTLSK